jgi:hypothetical protein
MPDPVEPPLSENQRTMLTLALACDLQIAKPSERAAIRERRRLITRHEDAAAYIQSVEQKVRDRRAQARQPAK